jgi:peptidoglycan/xylan/chitin deacetylase (PgdA/CDA1 family)
MSVPILMYHAVHPDRSVISLQPEIFAWQMDWLKSHDFRVISLEQLGKQLIIGSQIPERTVVLTFDDGYQCLIEHVFPILERLGFAATIFLVINHCGGKNDWPGQPSNIPRLSLLAWPEIRRIDGDLISFGSHTLNHPRLDQVHDRALQDEICTSKQILEDQLGHAVHSFCYPYGRISAAAEELVRGAYQVACGTHTGQVSNSSDVYHLDRVEISYLLPGTIFSGIGKSWFDLYLKTRGMVRSAASRLMRRQWN